MKKVWTIFSIEMITVNHDYQGCGESFEALHEWSSHDTEQDAMNAVQGILGTDEHKNEQLTILPKFRKA